MLFQSVMTTASPNLETDLLCAVYLQSLACYLAASSGCRTLALTGRFPSKHRPSPPPLAARWAALTAPAPMPFSPGAEGLSVVAVTHPWCVKRGNYRSNTHDLEPTQRVFFFFLFCWYHLSRCNTAPSCAGVWPSALVFLALSDIFSSLTFSSSGNIFLLTSPL